MRTCIVACREPVCFIFLGGVVLHHLQRPDLLHCASIIKLPPQIMFLASTSMRTDRGEQRAGGGAEGSNEDG